MLFGQRFLFVVSLFFFVCTIVLAVHTWAPFHRKTSTFTLFCEAPSHDFGVVHRGDTPVHRFVLENRGNYPISLINVAAGCGSCINVGDYTQSSISPKGKGFVTLQLQTPSAEGKITKVAVVKSNAPVVSYMLLTLSADIAAKE